MHRNVSIVMNSKQKVLIQQLLANTAVMLGEIQITMGGLSGTIANPGFWAEDGDDRSPSDAPPLRILVCGSTGVSKSTLINKVFGIDRVGFNILLFTYPADWSLGEHSVAQRRRST
jgi:hypothetical protein